MHIKEGEQEGRKRTRVREVKTENNAIKREYRTLPSTENINNV